MLKMRAPCFVKDYVCWLSYEFQSAPLKVAQSTVKSIRKPTNIFFHKATSSHQGCHDGRDVMWRKRHKPSWRYGQFVKYDGPFKNRHRCDGLWRFEATNQIQPKQVKSSRVGSQSYPSDHGRQVSRVNLTSCHRNLQVKYSVFKELTIFTSPSILRYPDITHKSLFYWYGGLYANVDTHAAIYANVDTADSFPLRNTRFNK